MLAGIAGCAPVPTRFDIDTLGRPGRTQSYSQVFDGPGRFATNAQGDYEFAFELPPVVMQVPPPSEGLPAHEIAEDAGNGSAAEPLPDEIFLSQLVHIHCIWRPLPGTTYAERSQTNATIVYCLIRGESAISYEGAGFVSFSPSRDGGMVTGELESSALFPTRTAGDPADLFGPCHVRGTFTARRDAAQVAAMKQRIRQHLGPERASTHAASE